MPPTYHQADSRDSWRYIVLLSKFAAVFVDGGIAKSFGVLIPEMVVRYDSDYRTVAFICSLHSLMFMMAPIGNILLTVITPRQLGIAGGLLTAVSIMCAPFANSLSVLGIMIGLTGFGSVMTIFSTYMAIIEFYPKSFIFFNTLTQFGLTCGAFTVPVIVERSLQAYGYQGAFLILGGICLHAVISGVIIRPPEDLASLRENSARLTGSHLIGERDSTVELQEPLLAREQAHVNCETESKENDSSRSNTKRQHKQIAMTFFRSLPSVREMCKSFILFSEPLCTLVIPAVFLANYVFFAWMLFLVPHAECLGIVPSTAVFLSTIAGISGICGRIVYLILIHYNFDTALILCLCCLISATSFFLDPLGSTLTFFGVMACLQGFVLFVIQSMTAVMVKLAVEDERNMPNALSIFLLLEAFGALAGDTLSGYLYDVTSSMHIVFISYGIALVIVLVNLLIFALVVHCKTSAPSDL